MFRNIQISFDSIQFRFATSIITEETHLRKMTTPKYAARSHRISKEELYALVTLFMEYFPLETEEGEPAEPGEKTEKYRKVGAALVLTNDKIFAIDCSRCGVHAVARLVMEHQDVVKDCKIFVSRKPCSLCTRLLVQAEVKEIFYLPIEPEYHQDGQETDQEKKTVFEKEKLWVDELFRVSAISQKVFVPGAGLKVVESTQIYDVPTEQQRATSKETLLKKYWNKDWLKDVKDKLPWPSFDEEMRKQIDVDFEGIMAWAAKIALFAGSTEIACKFQRVQRVCDSTETTAQGTFDPEKNVITDSKQAALMITLARFLAERTDDPKKGVGAVIIQGDKNRKVVGLGWNGFPTKAVYGQFPRASHTDESVQDKKYPFIVHAEQNAIFMLNTKPITDGILFVTKTPCSECTPLLKLRGIKTVVLGTKLENASNQSLDYQSFYQKVKKGIFDCFEMTRDESVTG